MPTSFAAIDGILMRYATGLASAARVFVTGQLARHPELSSRSMPTRRAGEYLRTHPEAFEHIHGIYPHLHLWRLTVAYKRELDLKYRNISASQHTPHWLAIGDVWISLTLNGLRPEKWFTEGKEIGGFDVFFILNDQPYLMEVQNSDLTQKEWQQKWHRRVEWIRLQRWKEKEWSQMFSDKPPKILLVTRERMKNATFPRGVLYSPTIEQLHWILKKPPQ